MGRILKYKLFEHNPVPEFKINSDSEIFYDIKDIGIELNVGHQNQFVDGTGHYIVVDGTGPSDIDEFEFMGILKEIVDRISDEGWKCSSRDIEINYRHIYFILIFWKKENGLF